MKKIIIKIFMTSAVLLGGLSGVSLIAERSTSSAQVISELSLLDQIVNQAEKVITARSGKTRLAAKKKLLSFVQEKELTAETRKKIDNAIGIILKTTRNNRQESQEAYQFLVDFVTAVEAQENLIKVAEQAKKEVENAPIDQKSGIVDMALKAIESATKNARNAIEHLRTRLDNMMKSSEKNINQKLLQLKQVSELAREILIAKEQADRLQAKDNLASLMNKINLDEDIKDAIAGDIQIIQETTDDTMKVSKEAYHRLLDIIDLISQRIVDTVTTIEEGKESIENSSVGSIQKISNTVKNKLENISNQFVRLMYSGANMLPLSYENRQSILKDRIQTVLDIIALSKNQELRVNAQQELKDLAQRDELDKTIKETLIPLLEKIKNSSVITREDIVNARQYWGGHLNQLEVLQKIQDCAYSIVFPLITSHESDQKFYKTKVQCIINWMDSRELYQKIRDEINPDIQIILETTGKVAQKSKEEAFARLENTIDQYRSFSERAQKTINRGRSKLIDLMPESIRNFLRTYPAIIDFSASALVGCAIGKFIVNPLLMKYRLWEANYAKLETQANTYNAIMNTTVDAYKANEKDKYHTLMGILEGLGIEITEYFDTQGEFEGISETIPRSLWSEKSKQLYDKYHPE